MRRPPTVLAVDDGFVTVFPMTAENQGCFDILERQTRAPQKREQVTPVENLPDEELARVVRSRLYKAFTECPDEFVHPSRGIHFGRTVLTKPQFEEIFEGYDPLAVRKVMVGLGLISRDRKGKSDYPYRLGGKMQRCYMIAADKIADGEDIF